MKRYFRTGVKIWMLMILGVITLALCPANLQAAEEKVIFNSSGGRWMRLKGRFFRIPSKKRPASK